MSWGLLVVSEWESIRGKHGNGYSIHVQARGQRCMSNDKVSYEFIGKLAIALCSYDIQICLPTLQKILSDKELYVREDIEQLVYAAYRHWEDNPRMQQAIAAAFTG